MVRTAIGVDIGGTHLRAARISASGEILARARAPSTPDAEAALAAIIALIREVDAPDVASIGIGVPGRVDFAAKKVLSGGYLNLASVPLAEAVEKSFNRPVTIDNDCSMALVAEAACGAARGHANAVMLTIGTGIGGAVLDHGRILRGRATAGQLGHVTVDPAGLPCACGRRGCVETVSSGTALGRHISEAGLPKGTTADELLARQAAGDSGAAGVLTAWAAPLRIAIDSLVATLDPGIVVLGGGLGGAAAAALGTIPARQSWYESPVVAASLGDDAGVIGAGLAALGRGRAGKRAVLVNGIPASGKSSVSHALSALTGWPVLTLDTIKDPFLVHLGGGDRLFNRTLGKASYQAIWSIMRDAPAGTTVIVDAWFGFQPRELLEEHLAMAGVDETAEVWCHAPAEVVAERYASRIDQRPPGHPGAAYVPELIALAGRAEPLRRGPLFDVDTTQPLDTAALAAWLRTVWPDAL